MTAPLIERKNEVALPKCVTHFSTNLNKQHYLEQLWALYDQSIPQSGLIFGKSWSTEGRRQSLHVAESANLVYHYNGAKQGQPIVLFSDVPVVKELRDIVTAITGVEFNFCLVNFYTQLGTLGLHSDDENGLDPYAPIVSLSFSHPCGRAFQIVGKEQKKEKYKIVLESGDLLLMASPCQQQYLHGVPIQTLPPEFVRVNLTFRKIV
jgi:alkylated DNA repair dioxygenase AlkB